MQCSEGKKPTGNNAAKIPSSSWHPEVQESPFRPLSAEEVHIVSAFCKLQKEYESYCRFTAIDLKEPSKEAYQKWKASGHLLDRKAKAILYNPRTKITTEYIVSLSKEQVLSTKKYENIQPNITFDEATEAENMIRSDLECQKILREEYGVIDMDLITCDPWSVGKSDPENRRLVQMFTWCRMNRDDENQYAHPIEGFLPIIDLNTMKVVSYERYEKMSLPKKVFPYHVDKLEARKDLKPYEVLQSEGPSFVVHGNQVAWQNWNFHVGFTSREGLVLNDITYCVGKKERSILYRASISEMVVPYGDPEPPHNRKRAFDEGEYGLGNCANSLRLGCDCLGYIHYFDACLTNTKGEPQVVQNAICLHEEDTGLLWKHVEFRNSHAESRRSRRLVVSMIAVLITFLSHVFTVVRYFYQDGKIEMKVKHTGQLNICGRDTCHGSLKSGSWVAPNLNGQYHQHFYSIRLDFSVDGERNRVTQVDVVHPSDFKSMVTEKNAMSIKETVLSTEKEAIQDVNPETSRTWLITSSVERNYIGQPTGYKIVPITVDKFLLPEDSTVWKRANFLKHNLWVTPYQEEEMHAAGKFPNQSEQDHGLGMWTSKDRSVLDKDIVVWYTFGITHIPQTEDWPVMPVAEAGFMLRPCNFFDWNPAMDVPEKVCVSSSLSTCI
eukprot:jgi/Galph1/2937/GphlegSOOS_G1606.1